jgi:hypothetical protein
MADISITNVFKFVGVRPVHLTRADGPTLNMIRDSRAETEAGQTQLRQLAEPLSHRDDAMNSVEGDGYFRSQSPDKGV